MKALLFVLPALVCQAQQPELPILAAKALRLPEGDLLTLQARLAADPAPAAQKAYDELYLTYNLATRRTRSDPKAAAAMVTASSANPTRAVFGIATSTPPRSSTTPVKSLNHWPIPIC